MNKFLCCASICLVVMMVACNHHSREISFQRFEYEENPRAISDTAEGSYIKLDMTLPLITDKDPAMKSIYDSLLSVYLQEMPIPSNPDSALILCGKLFNYFWSDSYSDWQGELPATSQWELTVHIDTLFVTDGIIAYYDSAFYYTGGAHGNPENRYYLFDRETGARLSANEVFDMTPENKQAIEDLLREVYRAQGCSEELGYWSEDNVYIPNNFFVDKDGMSFYYNVYEIACYANGESVFTLTKEQLKPYMKRGTALYNYWF